MELVQQVINYFQEMEKLKSQGVPIHWEQVAAAMATTLRQIPIEPIKQPQS